MRGSPIGVADLVEVLDETSPLYHRIGVVVAFTRAGRPVVEFRRKIRTWRHPLRGEYTRAMEADQIGPVPPLP